MAFVFQHRRGLAAVQVDEVKRLRALAAGDALDMPNFEDELRGLVVCACIPMLDPRALSHTANSKRILGWGRMPWTLAWPTCARAS